MLPPPNSKWIFGGTKSVNGPVPYFVGGKQKMSDDFKNSIDRGLSFKNVRLNDKFTNDLNEVLKTYDDIGKEEQYNFTCARSNTSEKFTLYSYVFEMNGSVINSGFS